jgi:hypothetical protein
LREANGQAAEAFHWDHAGQGLRCRLVLHAEAMPGAISSRTIPSFARRHPDAAATLFSGEFPIVIKGEDDRREQIKRRHYTAH